MKLWFRSILMMLALLAQPVFAADEEYRMGTGDWCGSRCMAAHLTTEARVGKNGTINFPLIGDKSKKAGDEKSNTQVAAKVNGTELTVHQVNFALQRIPNLTKEHSKEASLQVIRSLVDQQLLVQNAIADKLDRDPGVIQAMDAARNQILAEAYMQHKLGTPVAPTAQEVSDYYNKHPEFFAQRKLYRLQEIAIKASKDKVDGIRAKLAASKTLNEFGEWLKAESYPVKVAQGVKGPEQVPAAIQSILQAMPDGQAMVENMPDGLLVLILAGTQPEPMTEAQAKPVIERFLQNQKRQEAAKVELDKLKASAKIEYVGEFADAGKPSVAAEVPAATQSAPAATGDKPVTSNAITPLSPILFFGASP